MHKSDTYDEFRLDGLRKGAKRSLADKINKFAGGTRLFLRYNRDGLDATKKKKFAFRKLRAVYIVRDEIGYWI